jgi:hypothetical protein
LGSFLVDSLWWNSQIPDKAQPRKGFQNIMRDINFPPVKSLSLRSRIAVVVVMPSFSEGDQGEQPVVSTFVGGLESLFPNQVGEGVNTEGSVIEENRRDKKAPHKHLESIGAEFWIRGLQPDAKEIDSHRKKYWWEEVIPIEPTNLGIGQKILYLIDAGIHKLGAQHPANMGIVNSRDDWGMDIFWLVRMAVVVTMM